MEELFPFRAITTKFIYWKFYVLSIDRNAEKILILRSSGIKSFKENMSYLSTSTSIDDDYFVKYNEKPLITNSLNLNSQFILIEKLAATAATINDNNINDDVKENKTMNLFSNINLDCGPINSDRIQMSPYGAAIKSSDGWKAYDRDNNCIISVDGFTFDFGKTPMFYKIPVSPDMVSPGDLIVHNKKCLYVKGFKDVNEKNSGIYAVDIASNEEKVILPSKNIFNFNFIMKIVSMLDMGGNSIFNTMRPTESNPFGAYFQMMIMSEMMSGEKGDFDFGKMLMLQSMCGGGFNFPFMTTNNNS